MKAPVISNFQLSVNTRHSQREQGFIFLGLVLIFVMTWFVYSPGFSGIFLLDDYINLNPLKEFNLNPSWASAYEFISNGFSGPSGRPISLATFLLDASEWPESTERFRHTNLLIHLCNGLLLFLVVQRFVWVMGVKSRYIALVIISVWIIHPANTATVLYVIQRMTLIVSFFMISGLYFYLIGRLKVIQDDHTKLGYIFLLIALVIGLGFGMLSKENAIAFLLILLSAEVTVFSGRNFRGKAVWILVLIAPIVGVLIYIAYHWTSYQTFFVWRGYNVYQRLITQPVVLIGYLHNTLFPAASNIGIFNDQFPVVRNLFDSPVAILSFLFLTCVLCVAFFLKKNQPIAAFCIFAFFSAHLLESSVLPLELYFEHRNYLASVFVISLIVIPLQRFFRNQSYLLMPLFISALMICGFLTYSIAMVWGNPEAAAIIWTDENPDSVRARQFATVVWGAQGNVVQADAQLREGLKRHPRYLVFMLSIVQMKCAQRNDVSAEMMESKRIAEKPTINDRATLDALSSLREMSFSKQCPGILAQDILDLIDSIHSTSSINDDLLGYSWFIKANLLHDLGNLPDALVALDECRKYSPDLRTRFWQISWLINAGDFNSARKLFSLAHAEATTEQSRHVKISRQRELRVLEAIFDALDIIEKENGEIIVDPLAIENGLADGVTIHRNQNPIR